jgi:hypothetical protein
MCVKHDFIAQFPIGAVQAHHTQLKKSVLFSDKVRDAKLTYSTMVSNCPDTSTPAVTPI